VYKVAASKGETIAKFLPAISYTWKEISNTSRLSVNFSPFRASLRLLPSRGSRLTPENFVVWGVEQVRRLHSLFWPLFGVCKRCIVVLHFVDTLAVASMDVAAQQGFDVDDRPRHSGCGRAGC
jgi:hypothetical protein